MLKRLICLLILVLCVSCTETGSKLLVKRTELDNTRYVEFLMVSDSIYHDIHKVKYSWYENSPNVIRESFAYGTPVIASRTGGVPELVENGHNGFLFEVGDVGKLREILEEMSQNPSELERLSNGAFESARKYDMKEHMNKLETLYQQIAG